MSENQTVSQAPVLRRDENGICHLTLNRPRAYNALSTACMAALTRALADVAADPSVKVVILAGSGKGFCAGHDLKEMRSCPDREFYAKIFDTCTEMMLAITRLPIPVIAKVHGIATAAGCQLVATCDLAVAEEKTKFATPGVNIGLFCATPMVALSRSVARKHAMEMLLLGDMISADRAYDMGLVNRVAPQDQLDAVTHELAARIASRSPFALKIGKRAFHDQITKDLQGAYAHCSRVMVENMMAEDAKEGIAAFMEKRPPVWRDR